MFKRFIGKMAGKTSLINIKFDLDNLQQSFPHTPSAASKYLFSLMENIILARANKMTDSDITKAIQSKAAVLSPELQQIISTMHRLVIAWDVGNQDDINIIDRELNHIFQEKTGAPLDFSKITLSARIVYQKYSMR